MGFRVRVAAVSFAATVVASIALPAQAQVPELPGFYAGATGLWMFNLGDRVQPGGGLDARPGNGPGFNLKLGYKFDSPWDIALSGGAQWLLNGSSTAGGVTLDSKASHQNLDLEAGYSVKVGANSALRLSAGIRGAHFNQDLVSVGAGTFAYRNVWAFGPKIGIGGRTNITESIGLVGAVEGALLFGSFVESGTPNATNYRRLVPQIGAELGVQYRFAGAPSLAITAGGRFDAHFNPAFDSNAGRAHVLEIGPFVRLSYNLHAPNGARPMPPATAPAVTGAYMVFFDFDRSAITATAAETIKKAATDAKAGQRTRIGVTGHADRSGADAYNMALSFRRAEAVKAQLIREGIPATGISVVGRGESQPLVQTADGVREPQNRRVEIVLQ